MHQKWQIGDVSITRLVESERPTRVPLLKEATPAALESMPWLFPYFVTEDGDMVMSIHMLLVEAPGLRLVVDTCIGNDKNRGALTRNQPMRTDFLQRMEAAGWERNSVQAVVCTHLHVDHVGWNTMLDANENWVPTFPKAKYLIGRKEYEHWEKEDSNRAIFEDSVGPIFDAGLMQKVEMDHVLSPEIRLVPSVGHTPGHVSVVIESKGERAVITGDMIHHPCQFGHPEWSPDFDSDKIVAAETRTAAMKDWADKPILVIGTHFPTPTAGHVKSDGAAYRFDVEDPPENFEVELPGPLR